MQETGSGGWGWGTISAWARTDDTCAQARHGRAAPTLRADTDTDRRWRPVAESIAYNVDCMDYMRALPDKAFDLAVVDPPYGGGG